MRVRASEPEGVYRRTPLLVSWRQRFAGTDEAQVQRVEVDMGVEVLGMKRGRNEILLEAQAGLQEPYEASSRFQVPEIRFRRPDWQPLGSAARIRCRECLRLLRIANGGTGAVGFNEGQTVGTHTEIPDHVFYERTLSFQRRKCEATRATVIVDSRSD